ncbi:MAG: hypothetical protein WA063_03450 [Minisyncoccia bacterium]
MKKKITYVVAILFISAVLLGGCVSKDPPEKEEIKAIPSATSQPTQAPDNPAEDQQKGFSEPTFAIPGFVTYQSYSAM